MRIQFRPTILGVAFAIAIGSLAMSGTLLAQSGDEAAVNQAVEALRKAMVDTDRTQLNALTADNLSYGHSAGKIETKSEFVEGVMGKKTIFKAITLTEPSVRWPGTTLSRVVFSLPTWKPMASRAMSGSAFLQVWTKQGDSWKLYARQAFRL